MIGWLLHAVEALAVLLVLWWLLRSGTALAEFIAPRDIVQVPGASRLAVLGGLLAGAALLLQPAQPGMFALDIIFDSGGPWDTQVLGVAQLLLDGLDGWWPSGAAGWLMLGAVVWLAGTLALSRLWRGAEAWRAAAAILLWWALTAAFVMAGAHVLAWLLHRLNLLAVLLALYAWQRWRHRRD